MTKLTAKPMICISCIPHTAGNTNTERECVSFESTQEDTARSAALPYTGRTDTECLGRYGFNGNDDIVRLVWFGGMSNHDAVRRIPFWVDAETTGILSVTINLEERTLSDTFSMETAQPVDVGDAITGRILDLSYRFLAEETSQQGLIRTIKGMYDVDRLLYTPFSYFMTSAASAYAHAEKIAAGLGKSLVAHFENFYPTNTYMTGGATYQNIISGIFGWTDKLPQRSINIFIREDKLCMVQRGMEPNVVDLTPLVHAHQTSQLTVACKLVRSVWFAPAGGNNGNATDEATSQDDEKEPFTGTITFGDQSCSYVQGLLTTEVHGKEKTAYSYASYDGTNLYLSEKIKESDDETVTTEYRYSVLPHDLYLAMETETTVAKNDTSYSSARITRHYPVGNGWYGTTVEVDGMYQGSNLSQGKPGNKVSRYSVEQANTSLDNRKSALDRQGIQGKALFDTEFPVRGSAMLAELTKAIEWLDRKVQETISLDIWQYGHVIDFTDAIHYEGAVYHLVSNTVSQTPRELKQHITMVRWY